MCRLLLIAALLVVQLGASDEFVPSAQEPSEEKPAPKRWFRPGNPEPPPDDNSVRWGPLLRQSSVFLGIKHGFRFATEPGTRDGLKGPFFRDYFDAAANMHGWDDGDPFYVNYIGHPMQGAITNYIWVHNDGTYKYTQVGWNRDYWRSRVRALAFSYAYSTQFEIGPLSEASLGNIQSKYPAQGFVDHIITPVIGLGWTVGEDALDRFVIVPFEKRFQNSFARMMVRSWLNPARSFSNMLRLKNPWYRDTRGGIFEPYREYGFAPNYPEVELDNSVRPWQNVVPLEFSANAYTLLLRSGGSTYSCVGGGGGQVAFNVPRSGWSWVADINGCKIYGLGDNTSGDGLSFLTGPRYTWRSSSRLMPFMQLLVGGHKLSMEEQDLVAYWKLVKQHGTTDLPNEMYDQWVTKQDATAFGATIGGGVDLGVNRYLTMRLANLDYTYLNMNRPLNGQKFHHGARLNFGLVLRMGSW